MNEKARILIVEDERNAREALGEVFGAQHAVDLTADVDEALAAFPYLKVIWMQIGVENAEAAAVAVPTRLRRARDEGRRPLRPTRRSGDGRRDPAVHR